MITAASLRTYKQRDLAQMAKRKGVPKWHSMRKDELIQALVKAAKGAKSNANGKSKATASKRSSSAAAKKSNTNKRVSRRIQSAQKERERQRDLSTVHGNGNGSSHRANGRPKSAANGKTVTQPRDRIVLMVRDPYWLHIHWELTRTAVDRARAALAELWHTAKPILRLYEVDSGTTTNTAERIARDIEIHGGVQNWYVDVPNPPKSYVVEIGYLKSDGKFHRMARSNVVTTPRPGSNSATDENWADVAENCQKIYALSGGYASEGEGGELQELFEERLKRPMGTPMTTRFGMGAERFLGRNEDFDLQVEAEMILHGATKPNSHVMLGGEPIEVKPDGTFSVRMEFGNNRQVIPIVAESMDGVQQRTIVVGVERNTKVLELVTRDPNEV